MRVLGIDPGIAIVGFGVVEQGDGPDVVAKSYGCLRTEAGLSTEVRLLELYNDCQVLLEKVQPDEAAVEALFWNTNVTTGMVVSQARGVILLCFAQKGIPVYEYTPLQIKQALTGFGQAPKGQIQRMLVSRLGLSEIPQPDDAADALAVACCHAQSSALRRSIEA